MVKSQGDVPDKFRKPHYSKKTGSRSCNGTGGEKRGLISTDGNASTSSLDNEGEGIREERCLLGEAETGRNSAATRHRGSKGMKQAEKGVPGKRVGGRRGEKSQTKVMRI